jgi:hypothetical protein
MALYSLITNISKINPLRPFQALYSSYAGNGMRKTERSPNEESEYSPQ